MADAQTGEKTEQPSAKRLQDARKRGDVPRSADLVAALSLLTVTTVLTNTGALTLTRLQLRLAEGINAIDTWGRATVTPETLGDIVTSDGAVLGVIIAPVMIAAAVTGLVGNLVQSGWVFAPDKLTPDLTRLSPLAGFRRLAPSQSGMTLLKAVISVTIISSLLWALAVEALQATPRLAWMSPSGASAEAWRWVRQLLVQGGGALLVLALADVGWQWYRHYQALRMSKQDLRDEAKLSEGNPEIKARVRRAQREMTRKRMLADVAKATVVITNPTHFAVALEYRRGTMTAPVVLAKGQDLLAQKIKQLAYEHGVPTVENVPLAQALYKGANVGDAIPAELFGAVAEVLAYLVRIRQLML